MEFYLKFALIMLAAAITNATAGFGLALVSMPLLIEQIGIKTATPLVSLVSIVLQAGMVWHLRKEINFSVVSWLIIPSLIGVPLGVYSIDLLNETLLSGVLGVILILYVTYRLFSRDSRPIPKRFAPVFGFFGGLLGGAFNTSGPPVVLYAESQNWPRDNFRVNMQTYFLCNGVIGFVSHSTAGNYTADVWRLFLIALPFLLLGFLFGQWIIQRINQTLFQRFVLFLLVILGIRLLSNYFMT